MNRERLISFIETQSSLEDVILEYDLDLLKGPYLIQLVFSGFSIYIGINQLNDTILLDTDRPLHTEKEVCIDVCEKPPWKSFIGNRIQWIWELKNHLGYSDGVQFEFSDQEGRITGAFQCIAQASTISIKNIDTINTFLESPCLPTL